MLALFKIIKKNLKLLIRSKSSALIIILGPLLVIFLVGVAFDNLNTFSLNIGTFSEGYSELTESFITKLGQQDFKVQKIDSQEECVDLIKKGKLNTCIVFPKNLVIESDKVNEITFYVDNSKINLVWMILETISSKLTERSSELSLDLTTQLLDKVELTKTEMRALKPKITNLKTENQQMADAIFTIENDILAGDLGDLKTKTANLKTTLLEKISGAEKIILETLDKVNSTNTSSTEKTNINTRLYEINTYLYNMRSKFEEQTNTSVSDFTNLNNILNEIDTELRLTINSLKTKTGSSETKINEIQTAVDKVYIELNEIKVTNATTIVNPITTSIKPVVREKSNLNYLFPSLIILVTMFISILLSNTLVMMEKHSPAYFRNFITPINDITFILSTYLTNVILLFIQLTIILGISAYFFQAQILAAIPYTLLILLLSITFFTFVGMAIGYLFTSEETATLASISIGSIFLFLSNVILPLETMPVYVSKIAKFNPFVLGEELLRKAILFQGGFSELKIELLIMFGYSITLLVMIWLSQKIVRKHLFHKIAYIRHKKAKLRKEKKAKKK